MEVVSISLPPDLLREVDLHCAERGYKGRSEVARVALRQLMQQTPTIKGRLHGSLTIAYHHGREARMSEVRHAFYDVVRSMMHAHGSTEICLDILLVAGDADRVLALADAMRRQRDVIRCIFAPILSDPS